MYRLSPKARRKIVRASPIVEQEAKEYPVFTPNTGGQSELFEVIPLEEEYKSTFSWIYFRGGINSGKSWAGAAFSVSRTKIDPLANGLITANSYGQLRTATIKKFVIYCQYYGHQLKVNADFMPMEGSEEAIAKRIVINQHVYVNDVFVDVLSADAFDGKTASSKETGRGAEWRWVWYDEASYGNENIFTTLNGRIGRGPGTHPGLGLLTSSINKNMPYNFMYDYFDDPQRNSALHKLHKTVVASTKENKFIDDDFVARLEATYTKELVLLELVSDYISVGIGKVANYFDRSRHITEGIRIEPREPIHVSLDFNRHPACAIAGQNLSALGEINIFKEWYLENSNTFELAEEIAKWFMQVRDIYKPTSGIHHMFEADRYKLQIHGDATGNQKTANSRNTNWEIVLNTFKKYGISYQIWYRKANPNVVDTVNSVNCAYSSDKLFIDASCRELIKDNEQLKWNDKGEIDKKADLMRSHLFDCGRYFVNDIIPYERIRDEAELYYAQEKPVGILV